MEFKEAVIKKFAEGKNDIRCHDARYKLEGTEDKITIYDLKESKFISLTTGFIVFSDWEIYEEIEDWCLNTYYKVHNNTEGRVMNGECIVNWQRVIELKEKILEDLNKLDTWNCTTKDDVFGVLSIEKDKVKEIINKRFGL